MPIYFKPFIQESPLTIDSIGNHWLQEPIVRPSGFPLYHWLQTESGQGAVSFPEKEILLRCGEGLLISPDTPHRYSGTNWITSFLTFGGTLIGDIHKICGETSRVFVGSRDGAYFQEWINQTIHSYLENALDNLRLSVDCYEFLMHLSSIYTNDSLAKHPLYLQYVAPVIKKIETGYGGSLDVDSLALEIHITPQYLTRLFRRFTGYSARSYITRFRINKAKELLIGKPYLKIQSVGHISGYDDASYFISVFRQETGMTPNRFRKAYGIFAGANSQRPDSNQIGAAQQPVLAPAPPSAQGFTGIPS